MRRSDMSGVEVKADSKVMAAFGRKMILNGPEPAQFAARHSTPALAAKTAGGEQKTGLDSSEC